MVGIKKIYHSTDGTDLRAEENLQPAIGLPRDESEWLEDDEARAAAAYLKSVRAETSTLPFATVADFPEEAFRAPEVSNAQRPLVDMLGSACPLVDSVIEYFVSLREFMRSKPIEKQAMMVDFGPGDSDCLSVADAASVSAAIEDLAELTSELELAAVSEWLFALLVYLDLPLLEDTSAALQCLRRFCLSHPDDQKLQVCRVLIIHYFNQQ